jgi:hypothetical protein
VTGRQPGEHPADDFHRQVIRIIAQLSDASGSFLVHPVHDEAWLAMGYRALVARTRFP